jgi:hypothetical protein
LFTSVCVGQQNTETVHATQNSSLLDQIIDNLQLVVHDVHIRFEDRASQPTHPFSFGVTLSSFSVIPTDQEGENRFSLFDFSLFFSSCVGWSFVWLSLTSTQFHQRKAATRPQAA